VYADHTSIRRARLLTGRKLRPNGTYEFRPVRRRALQVGSSMVPVDGLAPAQFLKLGSAEGDEAVEPEPVKVEEPETVE
jgi:hypothetical protein